LIAAGTVAAILGDIVGRERNQNQRSVSCTGGAPLGNSRAQQRLGLPGERQVQQGVGCCSGPSSHTRCRLFGRFGCLRERGAYGRSGPRTPEARRQRCVAMLAGVAAREQLACARPTAICRTSPFAGPLYPEWIAQRVLHTDTQGGLFRHMLRRSSADRERRNKIATCLVCSH
jgi:hypothetical protein